ncbi:MAG: hypothetical protein HY704_03660 [Gemmatimonadetes bacterium]|nr:hypothetical protein [Gemmatimonadota bacterium]
MTPPPALWLALLEASLALPSGTAAQPPPPLTLDVAPATGSLSFRIGDLLADPGLTEAVLSGLPLRITVRTELWRDRFIDGLVDQTTWYALLLYEPLEARLRLRISSSSAAERTLGSLEAAAQALRDTVSVDLRPDRPGRYYYVATLQVETLALSDLEELRRWLRGELGPAVSGEREPESAVATGLQRLLVRMLGLPNRRFEARTTAFEIHPTQPPRPGA